MTGYTVHTGSTIRFSSGWDLIFPGASTTGQSGRSTNTASGKTAQPKKKPAVKRLKPKSALKAGSVSATKKSAATKAVPKKTAAAKSVVKKSVAKKTAAKKSGVRKTAAR